MLSLNDLNAAFKGKRIEYPNYPLLKTDQDTGEFFVQSRISDDEGNWGKHIEQLHVSTLNCVILRRRYQFMYYDPGSNLILASTSEFDDWGSSIVYAMQGNGEVVASGNYTKDVKPVLVKYWPKGLDGHMLKLRHYLYIEIKGVTYKLGLSASSISGGGKAVKGKYPPPAKTSYEGYVGEVWKNDKVHPINFETLIRTVAKSTKIGGKTIDFFCYEFEKAGENKKSDISVKAYNELDAVLSTFEKAKYGMAPMEVKPIMAEETVSQIANDLEGGGGLEEWVEEFNGDV